ncbi:MAG TPA: MarR family winged helix-turn-helix transcriptional regulator [Candidatus Saccharimonadales bacterium]|nr:MarR family winged helix-turn-helix transcriptional regulator [Candidatus Saccharimonadales bacterium]
MQYEDQPEGVGYLLQHVASTLARQSDQVLQERLGIGMSQFRILSMLQEQPNTSQRQIADSLGQTEASISRQVKLLQERGMLQLQVDPTEKRKHVTHPTAKGLKITVAAREVLNTYTAPMLDVLSDKELPQFQRMLTLLHEYTCAPGRPMACDRPFTIESVYDSQR